MNNIRNRSHRSFRLVSAGFVLTFATFALAPASGALAREASKPFTSAQSADALATAQQLSQAFETVAATIAPGVVSIHTTQEVKFRRTTAPNIPDEFRQFFESPFFRGSPNRSPRSQEQIQKGLGSGFVISERGYILTNNHVIKDADDITVGFSDGRTYNATVVGADPETDIAVLKVDVNDLTPLKLGDSDNLRVGQFVIAAGTPFGLTSTITTGVVSAKGRSRVGINDYENFIQTDAAINPGNSGGPLVNLKGEVIGVNSAILSRAGGNIGIGFAIPINLARSIEKTLIAEGHITRGHLGVAIQDLTSELANSFGYSSTAGALVAEVQPDTPADVAGFKPGDIITKLDGRSISSANELRLKIAEIKPGSTVHITVIRNHKTMTLKPIIGHAPDETTQAFGDTDSNENSNLGADLATLQPEAAQRFGLPDSTTGVIVMNVEPIGAAAKAGLRPGDVIVEVQNQEVDNLIELKKTLAKHDLTKGVRLTVRTQAGPRFVFLKTNR